MHAPQSDSTVWLQALSTELIQLPLASMAPHMLARTCFHACDGMSSCMHANSLSIDVRHSSPSLRIVQEVCSDLTALHGNVQRCKATQRVKLQQQLLARVVNASRACVQRDRWAAASGLHLILVHRHRLRQQNRHIAHTAALPLELVPFATSVPGFEAQSTPL